MATERPIIFSGAMVRAILDGRKTQTRRVVKLQPRSRADIGHHGAGMPFIRNPDPLCKNFACPYGHPGDRLWVRETWGTGGYFPYPYAYRADGVEYPNERWKPSIHMPRRGCRLVLEITGVRVERLQAISDADCWAEGAAVQARPDQFSVHSVLGPDGKAYLSPRGAFHALWTSTGGDWDANPWVWVVEFRRVLDAQPQEGKGNG